MAPDSITTSTLHLARLIGVRNIAFGVAMLVFKSGSAAKNTAVKLAALTEAADVFVSGISYMSGDMHAKQAIQSGGAAAVVALLGYLSL